jgi:hypothetical protein
VGRRRPVPDARALGGRSACDGHPAPSRHDRPTASGQPSGLAMGNDERGVALADERSGLPGVPSEPRTPDRSGLRDHGSPLDLPQRGVRVAGELSSPRRLSRQLRARRVQPLDGARGLRPARRGGRVPRRGRTTGARHARYQRRLGLARALRNRGASARPPRSARPVPRVEPRPPRPTRQPAPSPAYSGREPSVSPLRSQRVRVLDHVARQLSWCQSKGSIPPHGSRHHGSQEPGCRGREAGETFGGSERFDRRDSSRCSRTASRRPYSCRPWARC